MATNIPQLLNPETAGALNAQMTGQAAKPAL
jgi:hypothetical protein